MDQDFRSLELKKREGSCIKSSHLISDVMIQILHSWDVYAYGLKTVRVKRGFLLPSFFCYGMSGVGSGGVGMMTYLALAHM